MNVESLLLLQALEGFVDQAFADVQLCTFAPGVSLVQEGEAPDGLQPGVALQPRRRRLLLLLRSRLDPRVALG